MPYWLVLLIAGALLYIATRAPVFPAEWTGFTRAIAGVLIVIGAFVFLLVLLKVPVPGLG